MPKALFIYNPNAGERRIANQVSSILQYLQANGIGPRAVQFSGPRDGDILQTTLTQNSFDLIIISGGDGSINYLANLLFQLKLDVPLGIIPAGTSNDLSRNLKIPLNLKGALDVILSGKVKPIDVGLINDSVCFLSSCAGGLFADVSYNTAGELKKNLGPFAYYLKGVNELTRLKPFTLTVETEAGLTRENILLFFILNGPHAAGLSNLIKEAEPSDGRLYLILIKNCSLIDLAGLFFKILRRFSLRGSEKAKVLSAPGFSLKSDCEIVLTVDGEKGGVLPARLKVANQKLRVFAFTDESR